MYAMEQGSSRLRWSIIYAIGHAAAQHLEVLETALSDPDDYTACAAAQHLGSSGDPRAGPVLLEHVRPFHAKDPRFPLRLAVVQALGELRFADATEALIEVLWTTTFLDRRSNDVLRLAAAEALVRIGTERALSMVADRIEAERSHKIRKLAMRVARVLRLSAERRVEIHVP